MEKEMEKEKNIRKKVNEYLMEIILMGKEILKVYFMICFLIKRKYYIEILNKVIKF